MEDSIPYLFPLLYFFFFSLFFVNLITFLMMPSSKSNGFRDDTCSPYALQKKTPHFGIPTLFIYFGILVMVFFTSNATKCILPFIQSINDDNACISCNGARKTTCGNIQILFRCGDHWVTLRFLRQNHYRCGEFTIAVDMYGVTYDLHIDSQS